MSIASYNIGTATYFNGANQVFGVGTNWIGAGIREGDMFWADGLTVRIESLISNEFLVLAHNWPGEDKAGVPYEINYTHDNSRILAKTTEILGKIGNNSLGPLSSLVPSINTLPYFNGVSSAALTAFTPKARQILALNNNTQILENIGIAFQDTRYDMGASKVLRPGAFGLGSSTGQDIADIDSTALPTGFMTVTPATVLGTLPPVVGSKDGLLNFKIGSVLAVQLYFSTHNTSPTYVRRSIGSTQWNDWNVINEYGEGSGLLDIQSFPTDSQAVAYSNSHPNAIVFSEEGL